MDEFAALEVGHGSGYLRTPTYHLLNGDRFAIVDQVLEKTASVHQLSHLREEKSEVQSDIPILF